MIGAHHGTRASGVLPSRLKIQNAPHSALLEISMANSDDDSTTTSSSSSSSSSTSSPPSSSSSSSSISPSSKSSAAAKEISASPSFTSAQQLFAGDAIKTEDGYSDPNKSEDEGAITQPTTADLRSKRGGRIRGGQKKRPRSSKGDEDQNEDEDSGSDGSVSFVEEVQPIDDASAKKPSKRPRQEEDQQSADDAMLDVDASCCSDSPTTQYWSDQAKGPSGDGTIFEGMNQMAVADIVGWSHAIGGGNGSRLQLNGGRSDIPIPPWGLSLHQPPPFQPFHSEAAPIRSEAPPPPELLGLLLRCAEEKMNKSAERVMNSPQNNTEQERKMKILRQMNNMFDPSALIAAGVAVEELLTSALLPMAAAHVSRCRAIDHQARIISNRGRKLINKENGHDSKKDKKNEAKPKFLNNLKAKKKGGEETDEEEKESVDDAVALDRDAFDAWTLPPTEALLQLAKKRKLGQKCHRKSSAHRSNTSFLPSAAPTPKAIQHAMTSAGSDQEQVQANTVAAYHRSAAAWCQHHGLDSDLVQARMGDLFGLFLPKEPPRDGSNSSDL